MASNPRWLDVVRHRVRGLRAPYLLVLQHHNVTAPTCLSSPVTRSVDGDVDVFSPLIMIDGLEFRVRLLDTGAVPRGLLGDTEASFADYADSVLTSLDVILHGYPVGLPH